MKHPRAIVIRRAQPADIEVLVGFSASMARETEGRELDPQRLRAGTQSVFDDPARGFYLVAEVGGAPRGAVVGQLMITFEWSDWRNATFWWIQSVYVAPDWRRQGVYRQLHQAVMEEARQNPQVCGVRLYVERENRVAQTVYDRVGLARSVYQVFEEDFVPAKHRMSNR
ncbi:MAG: GNAT family N-acetyltransferase [Nitrospira sp.]|nr:MAG: GNAT family N-acetyltransferase [Nitrospira sp.]